MFNLSKTKKESQAKNTPYEKSVKTPGEDFSTDNTVIYNKMLEEGNTYQGIKEDGTPRIYNKKLEDDRAGEGSNTIYEKRLADARKESPSVNNEKQLNTSEKVYNLKRDDSGQHPMDYHQLGQEEIYKTYNQAKQKDKSKHKDTIANQNVGDQLITDEWKDKTILKNVMPSQLLSKYKTREEFYENNKFIDKQASVKTASVDALRDADGMLYGILRKAIEEERDLTKEEKKAIASIERDKARILLATTLDEEDYCDAIESLKEEGEEDEDEEEKSMYAYHAQTGYSGSGKDGVMLSQPGGHLENMSLEPSRDSGSPEKIR